MTFDGADDDEFKEGRSPLPLYGSVYGPYIYGSVWLTSGVMDLRLCRSPLRRLPRRHRGPGDAPSIRNRIYGTVYTGPYPDRIRILVSRISLSGS